MIIRSRAPVRISFGGGGTDLSPYCDKYGGLVLNTTINKYVYVTLIPNKESKKIEIISIDYRKTSEFNDINSMETDKDFELIQAVIRAMSPSCGFKLILRSDIPPNTGLGSSSSVAVALIGAFNQLLGSDGLHRHEIAELAYKVETEYLNNISGRQDQYASVYGGLNYIEFNKDDFVKVDTLKLDNSIFYELEKRIVLGFIEQRGTSGDIQKLLFSQTNLIDKNIKVLNKTKDLCKQMYKALLEKRIRDFGLLLNESWEVKKALSDKISNSRIDRIYEIGLKAGALGGKLNGAGAGGCITFICDSDKEYAVEQALIEEGVKLIPFSFENLGLVTWTFNKEDI
jgi:D-glycero-alpha-D-manno-heptose-7-phosphate kinase